MNLDSRSRDGGIVNDDGPMDRTEPLRIGTKMALGDLTDLELLQRARDGSAEPFGELFLRYRKFASGVARRSGRRDVDDVVQESFRRVLVALQNGKGPNESFGPYIATVVRSVCVTHGTMDRHSQIDEAMPSEPSADVDPRVAEAFVSLSESWQNVLWYVDVEGLPPREAAPLLGLPSANAVSALVARARNGLRSSYRQLVSSDACSDIGAAFDPATMDPEHLKSCRACAGAAAKLAMLDARPAAVIAPAMLAFHGFDASAAHLLPAAAQAPAAASQSSEQPSRSRLAPAVAAIVALGAVGSAGALWLPGRGGSDRKAVSSSATSSVAEAQGSVADTMASELPETTPPTTAATQPSGSEMPIAASTTTPPPSTTTPPVTAPTTSTPAAAPVATVVSPPNPQPSTPIQSGVPTTVAAGAFPEPLFAWSSPSPRRTEIATQSNVEMTLYATFSTRPDLLFGEGWDCSADSCVSVGPYTFRQLVVTVSQPITVSFADGTGKVWQTVEVGTAG